MLQKMVFDQILPGMDVIFADASHREEIPPLDIFTLLPAVELHQILAHEDFLITRKDQPSLQSLLADTDSLVTTTDRLIAEDPQSGAQPFDALLVGPLPALRIAEQGIEIHAFVLSNPAEREWGRGSHGKPPAKQFVQ